ncbi:hypothetical protein TNIN_217551 [Trichonephila inaurata madagascariensis]|uniref:Uncharacterized protein n=1 Tax=Trichonephila inaurata madagascariensis TaxID=2747483 RepID=A0A8X6Y9P2_9ARAC|nr:hypothetical protein TNIN_217551 [Trichonephila inaurata madagascariensis]
MTLEVSPGTLRYATVHDAKLKFKFVHTEPVIVIKKTLRLTYYNNDLLTHCIWPLASQDQWKWCYTNTIRKNIGIHYQEPDR